MVDFEIDAGVAGRIGLFVVFMGSFVTALITGFALSSDDSNPTLFGVSVGVCIISFFCLWLSSR